MERRPSQAKGSHKGPPLAPCPAGRDRSFPTEGPRERVPPPSLLTVLEVHADAMGWEGEHKAGQGDDPLVRRHHGH